MCIAGGLGQNNPQPALAVRLGAWFLYIHFTVEGRKFVTGVASNLERATSREVEIADKQKDAWHDTKKGKNDHCSSH